MNTKSTILSICGLACCSSFIVAQEKPNIIVFIADDAGMDFGCYGNKNIHTPNIDKLASSGIRFEKAFLTSPQSSPSRTSMMSGRFAHTIGTEDLHTPINDSTRLIPSYLKEVGYRTGVMLKTHWGPNGDKQFDWMDKSNLYSEDPVRQDNPSLVAYRSFIDANKQQPFFLWVGFTDPHRPYRDKPIIKQNNPNTVKVAPYYVDNQETRIDLANYYDEISRLDRHVGVMIEELEKRNLLGNTVIFFLSDNGMPFPRAKGTLYDSGIQTPFVVSWKGKIKPGSIHNNGLISTIDLAPTILDIAGIKTPKEMYGKTITPLLTDATKRGRDYIYSERNWHNCDEYIRCIRSEKYKLIFNAYYEVPHGIAKDLSSSPTWYALKQAQKNGKLTKEQQRIFECPRPMVEIYDLKNDFYELNNVADEEKYIKEGQKLMNLLLEWQKETNDHPWWKRKRPDNNDRVTGFPLFRDNPEWID